MHVNQKANKHPCHSDSDLLLRGSGNELFSVMQENVILSTPTSGQIRKPYVSIKAFSVCKCGVALSVHSEAICDSWQLRMEEFTPVTEKQDSFIYRLHAPHEWSQTSPSPPGGSIAHQPHLLHDTECDMDQQSPSQSTHHVISNERMQWQHVFPFASFRDGSYLCLLPVQLKAVTLRCVGSLPAENILTDEVLL